MNPHFNAEPPCFALNPRLRATALLQTANHTGRVCERSDATRVRSLANSLPTCRTRRLEDCRGREASGTIKHKPANGQLGTLEAGYREGQKAPNGGSRVLKSGKARGVLGVAATHRFLRKGVSLGYVGLNKKLKDLQDRAFEARVVSGPPASPRPPHQGTLLLTSPQACYPPGKIIHSFGALHQTHIIAPETPHFYMYGVIQGKLPVIQMSSAADRKSAPRLTAALPPLPPPPPPPARYEGVRAQIRRSYLQSKKRFCF